MNFFQEQARARQHTMWLVGIFALAVISLILITIVFLVGFALYSDSVGFDEFLANPSAYLNLQFVYGVSMGVVLLVGGGSVYKYSTLSSGGKSVAIALGGHQVNRNSATASEKKLLNVVEEMAIASGISTPTVFILEDEGINAFAAGLTLDDAVIGVTRGTVEKLDREELQGVIAHEFSHIFNGDMRLNLQLTATLHGILLIGLIGKFLLRSMSRTTHSYRSTSSKKSNGGLYLLALGAGLMVIGYAGTFFGSMIKANVSRKREYLADATAVQYTRYPRGISGALKKIAYYSSELSAPAAETYSHLYFANGISSMMSSLMATHPPLDDRIKKIEPRWNGRFPDYGKLGRKTKIQEEKTVKREAKKEEHQAKKERFTQGAIAAAMMSVGQVKEEDVEQVQHDIASLPAAVLKRLEDPLGAQAVVLSLLYDKDHKQLLFEKIQELHPYLLLEFASFMKEENRGLQEQSALVVALSLNALKSLSVAQYKKFKSLLAFFINIDKKVTLFEWSLQHIIERPLEMHLGLRKVPKTTASNLGAIKEEVEILYSMLAQAQYSDEAEAKKAFDLTKREMQAGALQYVPLEAITHQRFINAVTAIESAKPAIAARVFEGVLHLIKSDGKVSKSENTFVHAVAQLMQVPLPREFSLEA